ncbi:MAG: O-antigen ligase family protein [Mycobacteriales bacterium]|nr:O-antigen ligase family protein [Mycobacteriales bacterium]
MTLPFALGRPRGVGLLVSAASLAVAGGAASALLDSQLHPLVPAALVLAAVLAWLTVTRPAVVLALALTLSPLESLQLPLGPGALSPTEAALLLVALGWVARAVSGHGRTVWPSWGDAPVIALVLLALPSAVLGSEIADVAKTAAMWSAFYLAFLVAKSLDRREVVLVLVSLAVGAAVLGAQGVLSYLSSGGATVSAGGSAVSGRASSGIDDPNYYAAYLQLAAIPALGLVVGLHGRWRGVALVAVASSVAGIVLSLSRGATLGLALALVLLMSAWSRSRRFAVAAVVALAATLAVNAGPLVNSTVYETVSTRLSSVTSGQSSTNTRLDLWRGAVTLVQQHPEGIGIYRFETYAGRMGLVERGAPLSHAHNSYLNLAAELGLAGITALLVWLGVVARGLWRELRRKRPETFAFTVGLSAAFAGWAFQSLTVTLYQVQIIWGTFFVLAGLAAALPRFADEQPAEQPVAASALRTSATT